MFFCKQKWSGKRIIIAAVAAYSGKNWPKENKNSHILKKLYLEFETEHFTSFHDKYTDSINEEI